MTLTLPDESGVIPISPAAASALTDEDFLRHLVWSDEANRQLTKAARAGDVETVIACLRKQNFGLGTKATRKSVFGMRFDSTPVAWSADVLNTTDQAGVLFDIWLGKGFHSGKKKHRQQAVQQLGKWVVHRDEHELLSTGELLVVCELLRWDHGSLPDELLWTLWRLALTTTLSHPPEESDPTAAFIRNGELAWSTGLLFSHVAGLEALRERGRAVLWDRLEESSDGDGTPHAELLENLGGWLAAWIRATEWGHAAKVPVWRDDDQFERFACLVECAITLLGPNGRFSQSQNHPQAVSMLATGAILAGWKKKDPAFRSLLSHDPNLLLEPPSSKQTIEPGPVEQLSFQSDFSSLACLRSDWSRPSGRIVVTHHKPTPQLFLSANGVSWLSGDWNWQLNDDPRESADWRCSCWFSDEEVTFVELQWLVSQNVFVERQILLAHQDRFAIFADCVRGLDDTTKQFRSRFPLDRGVVPTPEKTTRAWRLESDDQSLRVFPLPLPDDFVEGCVGKLACDANSLTFDMPITGGAFLPIVFDWHPDRQNSPADWRTLTVTDEGRRVDPHEAGGYRLRVGSYQLLLYRSLQEKQLRSVLGYHTGHETVMGRFDSDGDVHPLLLVE